MRSVFFLLTNCTRDEVSQWLSVVAAPNGVEEWLLPVGPGSPVLYIRFYDDLLLETEPEDVKALKTQLGGLPPVILMADVSGRVPGDAEVREFAALVLGRFQGAAWDDHTLHCWTLAEIQSDAKVDGHAFFDYEGWHRERKHHRVE